MRCDDLASRFRALPLDEQYELLLSPNAAGRWVDGHQERQGVSTATAYRDWQRVRLILAREIGYRTPLGQALARGDEALTKRETRRARAFEGRVLGRTVQRP
jgi:hypothetical protein